jgi:hypothetical protein
LAIQCSFPFPRRLIHLFEFAGPIERAAPGSRRIRNYLLQPMPRRVSQRVLCATPARLVLRRLKHSAPLIATRAQTTGARSPLWDRSRCCVSRPIPPSKPRFPLGSTRSAQRPTRLCGPWGLCLGFGRKKRYVSSSACPMERVRPRVRGAAGGPDDSRWIAIQRFRCGHRQGQLPSGEELFMFPVVMDATRKSARIQSRHFSRSANYFHPSYPQAVAAPSVRQSYARRTASRRGMPPTAPPPPDIGAP